MKNQPFTITVSVKTPEGQTIIIDEVAVLNGKLWDAIYLRTPSGNSIKIENAEDVYLNRHSRSESSAVRYNRF